MKKVSSRKKVTPRLHVLRNTGGGAGIIRSPSPVVDIPAILLRQFLLAGQQILLDSGRGNHRGIFHITETDLTTAAVVAVLGSMLSPAIITFQSFSWNSRKLAVLQKFPKPVHVFSSPGTEWVTEDLSNDWQAPWRGEPTDVVATGYKLTGNKSNWLCTIVNVATMKGNYSTSCHRN